MKETSKNRYQKLGKPLLSGAVFVASVGLIGAGALAASSSLYNLKAENPANNNQLTAENWDALVTEVENLKNQISRKAQSKETDANEGIPSGAVIAFDSENCPEWWTRFANADGRFIMGTAPSTSTFGREKKNIWIKGGNDSIKLTISQLPPHSFHTFVEHYWRNDSIDKNERYNLRLNSNSHAIVENYHKDGNDNYSYTIAAVNWGSPTFGKTNTLWSGNSIDITNPYIKLLYCKKN